MSQSFKISYHWERHEEPDYYHPSIDAEQIDNSLSFFLTRYAGKFNICVDGYDTDLDLFPDFLVIFKYIPSVLEALEEETDEPVEFEFFEQGTQLGMWMKRQGECIDVWFEIVPGTSLNHVHMPETGISVPAHEFLSEWTQFIKDVLKALIRLQPELVDDESYVAYANRIDAVLTYATELRSQAGIPKVNNVQPDSTQQSRRQQNLLSQNQSCTISYLWETLENPDHFIANSNEDKLGNSLRHFIAHHKGQIIGNLSGERFCLSLKKDLFSVFQSLPSALRKLTTDTESLVKLDLSEQDLALFLSRESSKISAFFAVPSKQNSEYTILNEIAISIPAQQFLMQWNALLKGILAKLIEYDPTLNDDDRYQEYLDSIKVVEHTLNDYPVAG